MERNGAKTRGKAAGPSAPQPQTQACVRIRPLLAHEENEASENPWFWEADKLFRIGKEGPPLFEGGPVYGPEATTEEFYKASILPAVQAAYCGTTATVLAYGEASSGKSHSLFGSSQSAGIIWHSLSTLFAMRSETEERCSMTISYCEIYNEVISDLLDPRGVRLNLVEDIGFGVRVDGAAERDITSADDALFLLRGAEEHRKFVTFRTDPYRNARSTSVLRVHLRKPKGISSLFIVDLESSGQLDKKKGAQEDAPSRVSMGGALPPKDEDKKQAEERKAMRKRNSGGLFTLRTVVSMLSERGEKARLSGPPPQYRDSKLTRLLKNAFDGTGHVAVLCAISPAAENEEETVRTLFFACKVAKIRGPATGKSALPKAFFEANEEDNTFAKPLLRLETAADAVWHEVSPLPRLCRLSEYLPVSAAMLLDLLLQREAELEVVVKDLADFRRTLPPIPIDLSAAPSAASTRAVTPEASDAASGSARQSVAESFRKNAASIRPTASAEGVAGEASRRLASSASFKVRGGAQPRPAGRLASAESVRQPNDFGRAPSTAASTSGFSTISTASSMGLVGGGSRSAIKALWIKTRSVYRRLQDCRQKLDDAMDSRKSWKTAEEELAMDDLDLERSSADRKGKPWRATERMEAARRRVIKSGGRRAKEALEKYNGAQMHHQFQKKVESLEGTLNSVRERLAKVAKIKSAAEKMEELGKIEREIEEKRSDAIDKARHAQHEVMATLHSVLEQGEEGLPTRPEHLEMSEEEASSDEEGGGEDQEKAESQETAPDGPAKPAKGAAYRARGRKAKPAGVSDEEFGFLSGEDKEKDKAAAVVKEERDETEGMQTILAGIWDEKIETVEALVLGALVDIEVLSKEVIASQRQGTFESPALQWPAPDIGVAETLSLVCMGDNRFGQTGAGQTGPEGQAPKKVQQKLFKGGHPLQVDSSWRNSIVISNQNQIVQLGITDVTLGSGEKPPRGTDVTKSQIVYPVVKNLASHRIMAVSCGWQHSLLVSQAGVVFSWGFGGYGALGHGNKYNYDSPALIESLLGQLVKSTAAGSYSSFAVTASGAVLSWGWGQGGQLGHGNTDIEMIPAKVDKDATDQPLPPMQKAACGHEHTFLLSNTGHLYSAGVGKNGRLGFPCITEEIRFKIVHYAANKEELAWVQDVSCGFAHTALLDGNQRVYTCGQGDSGALGHGPPLADEAFFRCVKELPPVSLLSCGGFFTACACATDDGEAVWTFGRNEYQQLGRGSYVAAEAKIAASRLKKMPSMKAGIMSMVPSSAADQLEDGVPSPAVLPNQKDIRKGAIVRLAAGHTHLAMVMALPSANNGTPQRRPSRPPSPERMPSERVAVRPPSATAPSRFGDMQAPIHSPHQLGEVRAPRSRSVSPEPHGDSDPFARPKIRNRRSPEPAGHHFPTSTRRDRLPSVDRSALPDLDDERPSGSLLPALSPTIAPSHPSGAAYLPSVAGRKAPAGSPQVRPLAPLVDTSPLHAEPSTRPLTSLRSLSNSSPSNARLAVPGPMQAPRRPSLRPVNFVMDPPPPNQSAPRAHPLTHQGSLSRLRPLPLAPMQSPMGAQVGTRSGS